MFDWLRRHRRRRLLETPFPNEWTDTLRRNVKHYVCLIASEQAKLRDDLRILVAEKNWEGCCGLTIDDEIKVTIAAQASLLLLGFRNKYFDLVRSILVYPDAFVAPDRTDLESGLVLEGESTNEGEAWYRGPVVLSWPDALSGGRGESDGRNLVVHEFAHQLDMESGGEVDGTPVLGDRIPLDRWHRVMHAEFERLVRDCRRGRKTILDPYGTTDMGEFFAVATECFFEQPLRLQEQHPNLYELLGEFFRQDPAMRSIPGHTNPLD